MRTEHREGNVARYRLIHEKRQQDYPAAFFHFRDLVFHEQGVNPVQSVASPGRPIPVNDKLLTGPDVILFERIPVA